MSVHKNIIWSSTLLALLVSVAWAMPAEAQGRRRGPVRVVVSGGYYYNPFWYDDPYLYEGQYPMGPYGPYGRYGFYNRDPGASVRLEVRPKEAEVYVDGYYAGVVDDFDGTFQRLRVEPGGHEVELYLDGYRTVHQKVYLTRDNTFKMKYDMQRLASGEQAEARPQLMNPPPRT